MGKLRGACLVYITSNYKVFSGYRDQGQGGRLKLQQNPQRSMVRQAVSQGQFYVQPFPVEMTLGNGVDCNNVFIKVICYECRGQNGDYQIS